MSLLQLQGMFYLNPKISGTNGVGQDTWGNNNN